MTTKFTPGNYTETDLPAAAPEMYEALKAAEWGGNRGERVCPVCRRLEFEGHKTDCLLANALAKANGGAA